jgi:hypothetical protein
VLYLSSLNWKQLKITGNSVCTGKEIKYERTLKDMEERRAQWLTSIILITQEVEIWRIVIQG